MSSGGSSSSSTAELESSRVTTLDQSDFLDLLVVQLTNQNPMDPMADTEFISQMANFSALEQSKDLSESFAKFSSQQMAISSQGYLGHEVDIETDGGSTITGVVDEVSLTGDNIQVRIDGTFYDASNITAVRTQQ